MFPHLSLSFAREGESSFFHAMKSSLGTFSYFDTQVFSPTVGLNDYFCGKKCVVVGAINIMVLVPDNPACNIYSMRY